jgi:hypothetical protein
VLIRSKRRTLTQELRPFRTEEALHVALPKPDEHLRQLADLGFSIPLTEGEQTLPPNTYGIASRRNADGEEIVHRELPLETHYRQREWKWQEFRGRYDTVEQTRIVEVPYQRYPRTVIPPYAIELQVRRTLAQELAVVAGPLQRRSAADLARLLNTVHLFVEIFGECALVGERLSLAPQPSRRVLNWEILPPGKYPWARAAPAVAKVVDTAPESSRPVIRARFEAVSSYEPDFVAIGRNGFLRYVVFGWDEKALYLLESTEINNATYVLRENWEVVSAMTKAQVLDAGAHLARFVHRDNWFSALANFMRGEGLRAASQDVLSLPGHKQ